MNGHLPACVQGILAHHKKYINQNLPANHANDLRAHKPLHARKRPLSSLTMLATSELIGARSRALSSLTKNARAGERLGRFCLHSCRETGDADIGRVHAPGRACSREGT